MNRWKEHFQELLKPQLGKQKKEYSKIVCVSNRYRKGIIIAEMDKQFRNWEGIMLTTIVKCHVQKA